MSESNQVSFLTGAWGALLQDHPEPFDKRLLADFVSGDVLASLPPLTTLKHVLRECLEREAFQESYIKSFLGLRKVWDKLTPESRKIIMGYSQRCGLGKQGGLRLQPLEDDAAALTIRWDVAERLYLQSRAQAFEACGDLGLEMVQPRRRPKANEFAVLVQTGQELMLKLLRERINIDKTAVTMAVGYVTPVARTRLTHNLDAAYQDCGDAFRAALLHWATHHPGASLPAAEIAALAEGGYLTAVQEAQLHAYVGECLRPFELAFARLRRESEELSSEPTLYERVRRCFQDPVLH